MEVTSVRPRMPSSPRFRTGDTRDRLLLSVQNSDDDGSDSKSKSKGIGCAITKRIGGTSRNTGRAHTAFIALDSETGTGAVEGPEKSPAPGPYANAYVNGVDDPVLTFARSQVRFIRRLDSELTLDLNLLLNLNPREHSDSPSSLPADDPAIQRENTPCYDYDSGLDFNCRCCLKRNMTSVVHHHHQYHSGSEHIPVLRSSSPPSESLLITPSNHVSTPTPRNGTEQSARCACSLEANTPRKPIGLLDLPNEIMLSILEDLPSDDLYSFSFTSRKFHQLSLTCYLARYGVGPLRRHRLMLFDEMYAGDVVKALEAALFRPVLNGIYYSLVCAKGEAGKADKLQREMRMLCALLDKASSVRETVVNVDRVNGGAVGDGRDGHNVPDFTCVLDCALRKGCQSLSVYHSGAYSPDVEGIEDTIARSFTGARGLVKKYNPSNWVSAQLSWISRPQQSTSCSLTHFGLHSPILFHPRLCSWTIDTLNTSSSLTNLTITHQLSTPPYIWALVLPHITIPKLSRLSIDLMTLASEDLYKFLKRHETIERLNIGRSMGSPNPFVPFPKSALKNVSHLSGPPKWLAHMLLPPGSLPALKRATIVWREKGTQRLCGSFMGIHVTLMPVLDRVRGLEEVGLRLSFGSVSTDWIPSGRYRQGYESFTEDGIYGARGHMDSGGGAGLTLSSISTQATTRLSIENIHSTPTSIIYTHTTHLELEIPSYSMPFGIMTQNFVRWLEGFERLGWLALMTLRSGVEEDSEGGGLGGGPFASALQKDMFVDSIKAACPKLQTVDFGCIREDGVY